MSERLSADAQSAAGGRGPLRGGDERGVPARELAFAGLFGAAAFLLPTVFHLLQLGHAFMPMYLPLAVLGFLVSARTGVVTAIVVPLLSGAVTGMPPFFPPIAPIMTVELAVILALIAVLRRPFRGGVFVPLLIALLAGRVVNYLLTWLAALLLDVPAFFAAGLSLLVGWPGVVLMLVVVPPLVRLLEMGGRGRARSAA